MMANGVDIPLYRNKFNGICYYKLGGRDKLKHIDGERFIQVITANLGLVIWIREDALEPV